MANGGAEAMPGERYIYPPSLRQFLDQDGDLGGFSLLDSLVEAIVVARRLLPAETNRRQAVRNRRFVERWFARHGGEAPVRATQELLTFAFWKAECLEDAALAERFEAALPAETLSRALQLVEDLHHVHPLSVQEELDNWSCRACGETFSRAAAVIVTNTGDDLGYEEDLTYCLGCLSIATAALETVSGIDRFSEGIDDERLRLRPSPDLLAPVVAEDQELVLVDDDGDEELVLDEDTVRSEAARLTAQLEASQRRVAALEARRAALIRRLESGRGGETPGPGGRGPGT
jgi:hypothetical protein